MKKRPVITIVGGGAGGLELATKLGNSLGKNNNAKVILIDRNLSYVWKPLWHEVASGMLESHAVKVNYITHGNQNGFEFRLGEINDINTQKQTIIINKVITSNKEILPARQIHYDKLIIGIGSVHNDFNISGIKEHCFSFDNIEECESFSNELLQSLIRVKEQIDNEINIAVIGGGATGVELIAEIESAIHQSLNSQKNKLNIQLYLIESSERILSSLAEDISAKSHKYLTEKNIKIFTNQTVTHVDENFIYFADGEPIKARIKLWAAGIKAPELLTTFNLPTNRKNQLLIKETLQSIDNDNVFAIGDCANFNDSNKLLPATAQLAHQQAVFLANSLTKHILLHSPLKRFTFKYQGSLVSLGAGKAYGEVKPNPSNRVFLKDKLGYFAYRFLYRKFQISIYGIYKTTCLIIADFFASKVKPRLKLH